MCLAKWVKNGLERALRRVRHAARNVARIDYYFKDSTIEALRQSRIVGAALRACRHIVELAYHCQTIFVSESAPNVCVQKDFRQYRHVLA